MAVGFIGVGCGRSRWCWRLWSADCQCLTETLNEPFRNYIGAYTEVPCFHCLRTKKLSQQFPPWQYLTRLSLQLPSVAACLWVILYQLYLPMPRNCLRYRQWIITGSQKYLYSWIPFRNPSQKESLTSHISIVWASESSLTSSFPHFAGDPVTILSEKH